MQQKKDFMFLLQECIILNRATESGSGFVLNLCRSKTLNPDLQSYKLIYTKV
jgi:hypothetical protein